MKPTYFLPWWSSDYVWKQWETKHDLSKDSSWTKAYIWDLMPNFLDGILVSRMAVSPKRIKNLRQELHFNGIILGDSGAHSYRELNEPPFSCQDILDFYANGSFNYGLTLDMVASPWVRRGGLSDEELEYRLETTLVNAEKCMEIYVKYQYPYELIGVVQGWDRESYRYCSQELLKLGFNYLAIAGQRKISLVKDAILAVKDETNKVERDVKIHVLGTGSPKILSFYVEQGITSFDSATWLRQAWMNEESNYFVVSGTMHRSYRATRVGLDAFDINQLLWSTEVNCSCPLCEALGQEILLFRGHERNTRRGFHNIYQYVQLLNAHRVSLLS